MFSDTFDLLPASRVLLFPFVFGSMSVLCSPGPLLPESGQVYVQRVKPHRRAEGAHLRACGTGLPSLAPPGQRRRGNTRLILGAPFQFHGQLSSLHTSSPSFQGIIIQPSKYQNVLWFETWCTASQAPE